MLTGFNSDVRHRDEIFHVQTEDKGVENPIVESLVYLGGRVLAARRVGYGDLLAAGKGDKDVQALMDRQHRLMIAAVQSGKLDHKLRPSMNDSHPALPVVEHDTAPQLDDGVSLLREAARAEGERSLDQVILDYLAAEAGQEHLDLQLAPTASLRVGMRGVVTLLAKSSKDSRPVRGALVVAKLISTATRPAILGSGETDAAGRIDLDLDVPVVSGVAALVISATSEIGNAEIKHLL